MAVGLGVGVAGGLLLGRVAEPVLAAERRALHAADARRGGRGSTASPRWPGGSGVLAVFVAGLLVGDLRAPFKAESEVFHESLSSLAEIVVFIALGLTISISALGGDVWLDGCCSRRGARVRRPAGRRFRC